MSNKTRTKQISFSLPTGYIGAALTSLLLILKLTGIINASWLLVFLPLIIGAGVPTLFVLMAMAFMGVITFLALASAKK